MSPRIAIAQRKRRLPALVKNRIATSFGDIAYLETGRAGRPPVLLVHGIPTSSFLWRHVLRFLQNDFHCYAPDLMGLGDTEVNPARARFDMDAQGEMLLELMTALGHETFAIVCHDQGGAATQYIAAHVPERLTALVLTNCVCYDNWPVPLIRRLQRMARRRRLSELLSRIGISEWLETTQRFSSFRRGVHDPTKLGNEAIREYLRPMTTRAGRERFRQFLLAGDPSYTQRSVPGLRQFDKPTLVAWAADDRFLSPSWGRQLYEDIPGATQFEVVPFCGHFWQEERPAEISSLIREFLLSAIGTADGAQADTGPPAAAGPACAPTRSGKRSQRLAVIDAEKGR
jgi:pimeloyl-ACP methyl ester carboxylesterase